MTSTAINNTVFRKQLFASPDAHPIALNLCLLREFGPQYLGWEPETCWDEVRMTFGVTISEANRQKVQAVRSIYVATEPLTEWEVFEAVAAGLVGIAPRVETVQRATPGRAHIALDIIKHVRAEKIGEEVYRYCAAALRDAGLIYGPGSLEPANAFLPAPDGARAVVKRLVDRGALPANLNGADPIYVQAMKSLAVVDFAKRTDSLLAAQIRQLVL